jgi:hypothetical protein
MNSWVRDVLIKLRDGRETTARTIPGISVRSTANILRHAQRRGHVTSRRIGRDVYWKLTEQGERELQ